LRLLSGWSRAAVGRGDVLRPLEFRGAAGVVEDLAFALVVAMRMPDWMPATSLVARVQLSWRIAAFFCSSAARSALSLSALALSAAFFFLSRSDSGAEEASAAAVVVAIGARIPPAGLLTMFLAGVPGGGGVSPMCS
jgi:hypothetical protein